MRKLLPASQGVLRVQVDARGMPDRMIRQAGLGGGNNGARSERCVAIDGWVAAPVSRYGAIGTCRSADLGRSANRTRTSGRMGGAPPGSPFPPLPRCR